MKILVAGGAGFIGSRLVPALLDHGYEVVVIDALWFGNKLPAGVKVIQKNLFDCTESDLTGYEQIIFLAGISNDPMAEFSPSQNFIMNGALPSYLAFIAKRTGIRRYIYASSCSVYGYTVDKLYDEESPVTCSYPYGISKLQGERGVMQLRDENFSVIALRQGTVCGYSPRMRFDLIINTMFKTAITEGKITVNNASIWRPIFDIRDTVTAFIRCMQANYSISGIFNATSGNFTVGQAADSVKEEVEIITGKKIRLEIKNIQDFRNYKVSWEKAVRELGYQPQYSIKDIVKELAENQDKFGNYEADEFYNIRTFKKLNL